MRYARENIIAGVIGDSLTAAHVILRWILKRKVPASMQASEHSGAATWTGSDIHMRTLGFGFGFRT